MNKSSLLIQIASFYRLQRVTLLTWTESLWENEAQNVVWKIKEKDENKNKRFIWCVCVWVPHNDFNVVAWCVCVRIEKVKMSVNLLFLD